MNILLVDDDLIDIMYIEKALINMCDSYQLKVANDGVEALNLLDNCFKEEEFLDLILLDINMPRMNGIEFLQEMRMDDRFKELPVIIMTTSSEVDDILLAYKQDVIGYVIKSLSPQKLSNELISLRKHFVQTSYLKNSIA